MDKLKKVNIWRFVEGLGLDLKRKQLIGKLIEEIMLAVLKLVIFKMKRIIQLLLMKIIKLMLMFLGVIPIPLMKL